MKFASEKAADEVLAFARMAADIAGGSEGPVERLQGCVRGRNICGFDGLCPVWIVGQVKHGDAPRVDGQ